MLQWITTVCGAAENEAVDEAGKRWKPEGLISPQGLIDGSKDWSKESTKVYTIWSERTNSNYAYDSSLTRQITANYHLLAPHRALQTAGPYLQIKSCRN